MTTWREVLHPGRARDFFLRRAFPPFDSAATGCSATNALWLAELSRLVYRYDFEEDVAPPQPGRIRFIKCAGLRQIGFFQSQSTHTQAMLVESENPAFAALVFRGTEQHPRDFITDVTVHTLPISDRGARVHAGFAWALDSVWHGIEKALRTLACPVFYTGHSLGAALATIAAARRAPRALYTFGSPRVGNAAFAALLDNVPIYRFVDAEDAVTRVPPEMLGYQHVGEVHALMAPAAAPFGLDPRAWYRRIVGPPAPLADHAPVNYVDRITLPIP